MVAVNVRLAALVGKESGAASCKNEGLGWVVWEAWTGACKVVMSAGWGICTL